MNDSAIAQSSPLRAGFRRRGGFTLIELLAVLCIVVVLASLLLPAIATVKNQAKSIRCSGNVRQMLAGIVVYSQDWDGLLVCYETAAGAMWFDLLAPYLDADRANGSVNLNNRNIFVSCPVWNWTGSPHWTKIGYGMCHDNNVGSGHSFWSSWPWISTGNVRDGTLSELTYPGSRILVGESGGLYIQASGSPPLWAYWTQYGYNQALWEGSPAAANPVRHSGRANYGFVDGHVQSLGPLTSPWGYSDPAKLTE